MTQADTVLILGLGFFVHAYIRVSTERLGPLSPTTSSLILSYVLSTTLGRRQHRDLQNHNHVGMSRPPEHPHHESILIRSVQFAALLASVGKDGPSANTPAPASKSPATASTAPKSRPTMVANTARPAAVPSAPTLKRKAEEGEVGARPKTLRTESNPAISRTTQPTRTPITNTARPTPATTTEYKGTARTAAAVNPIKPRPVLNTAAKPAPGPSTSNPSTPSAASAPKKGGFAATLARAAAAQQAVKATGGANIVHKPVEKLSRRERERQRQLQEAADKQKQKAAPAAKGKQAQQAVRSRSGTPGDAKAGLQQKKGPTQLGYSGTMRKPVEVGYTGTMRAKDPAKPAQPVKQKDKFGGQDKYGGYASWSDLSGAEEDEGDYMSDSDDMEGGFDEMEREEAAAARLARKEDQEALAEEERLKNEKAARKRKLEAMARQAQSKKRF
jgi:hypothetical protein